MKRAFLTFALTLMLTASLAACTTKPANTNTATGSGTGGVVDDNAANSRARSGVNNGDTMYRDSRYYADGNGNVYGGNSTIGSDIRNATNDVVNGVGDAINGVGNAVNDMTH